MMARHNPDTGDDKTVGIGHRQDVTGFSPLTPLINHTFASHFWQGHATHPGSDAHNPPLFGSTRCLSAAITHSTPLLSLGRKPTLADFIRQMVRHAVYVKHTAENTTGQGSEIRATSGISELALFVSADRPFRPVPGSISSPFTEIERTANMRFNTPAPGPSRGNTVNLAGGAAFTETARLELASTSGLRH